jgi:hypothetical protein
VTPRHSLGDARSSLSDAKSSLSDAKSSLGDAESSLGDARSSLADDQSSLGDAKSSLGDAKSWATLRHSLRVVNGGWVVERADGTLHEPRWHPALSQASSGDGSWHAGQDSPASRAGRAGRIESWQAGHRGRERAAAAAPRGDVPRL